MSTQCRHFVQNAWKKELCSNCFKSREEHSSSQENLKPIVARTANNVKKVSHKVQGILRPKESSQNKVRSKRKNVAFPESLTEIIGYDGGDDFDENDQTHNEQSDDPDSSYSEIDDIPDSEEERALGNLTRANTNFNTVTANLNGAIEEAKAQSKAFSSLMLGRVQKDGVGKKTTLLVSVKPFGGDDSVPTAKRPMDKKSSPDLNKSKSSTSTPEPKKDESVVKAIKKPVDEKSVEMTKANPLIKPMSSSLGQIVDMPLITSSVLPQNFLETQKSPATVPQQQQDQKRTTSIARTPAIKKSENEKPRIVAQAPDSNVSRNQKNLEISNGVELNLSPIKMEGMAKETSNFNKDTAKYKNTFNSSKSQIDLAERKVEGEAATDKYPALCEQSRESAGEPDGKADEEFTTEPPALPKSPPPLEPSFKRLSASAEPRTSFLHSTSTPETKTKPTVPQKPLTLPSKAVGSSLASLLIENRAYEFRLSQKAQSESQLCVNQGAKRVGNAGVEAIGNDKNTISKVVEKDSEKLEESTEVEDEGDDSEASSSGEQPRSASKRRMAPQPPTNTDDSAASNLFTRNITSPKSDCPVVREKEKRERASSCSPKFRKAISDVPDPANSRPPEPAPRRNISLSQDSLAGYTSGERVVEEKKKSRSKFSLKKFLRMGSRKDVDMTCGSSGSKSEEIPSTPQPKPRLEIIHPLELDGAAVQVVRNDRSSNTSFEDTNETKNESPNSWQSNASTSQHITTRPSKPPPPPRAQSLDESLRSGTRAVSNKQHQQQQTSNDSGADSKSMGKSWQPNNSSSSDSIYANLGPAAAEGVAGASRSALAPIKPRRTSSLRDQASAPPSPTQSDTSSSTMSSAVNSDSVNSNKSRKCDAFGGNNGVNSQSQEMVRDEMKNFMSTKQKENKNFENCSNASNCEESNLELRHQSGIKHPMSKRQSDSGILESNNKDFKFQQSLFNRSTSLPYCSSENENEIFSQFKYGDECSEGNRDTNDSRLGRLRQGRGRSIVHRSLEDNYGAVIVANHEALAQILEQSNKTPLLPPALRGLKTANLRFRDFNYDLNSAVLTGRRVFIPAIWNEQQLSVCLTFEPAVLHTSRKEFYLAPVVEFVDTVPKEITDLGSFTGRKSSEAIISVLPRLQVNTLKSFVNSIPSERDDSATRELLFILLQLVSAFKSLQAQGIEEAPKNLANVVLCREEKDAYHRLYLFQGLTVDTQDENCASLCQCALGALDVLNLTDNLPLIQELLAREKAVTLSQVKSILEFSLWGPADATLGGPREREVALQRWLDLERATVLQALVMRARSQLSLVDEYQLLFLVRTSAKRMCEASLLLDRQRNGLLRSA